MVTHKLGLKDGTPFAIFEVSSDEEERVLDEDERVLDIIAYWQKTYDDDRAKNPKHVETYKFMYKVRLFWTSIHKTNKRLTCSIFKGI